MPNTGKIRQGWREMPGYPGATLLYYKTKQNGTRCQIIAVGCKDTTGCTRKFVYDPDVDSSHDIIEYVVSEYDCDVIQPVDPIPISVTPPFPRLGSGSTVYIPNRPQVIIVINNPREIPIPPDPVIPNPNPMGFVDNTIYHFRLEPSSYGTIYPTWYTPQRLQQGVYTQIPQNQTTIPPSYTPKKLTFADGEPCARMPIELTLTQWYSPAFFFPMMASHRWFTIHPYTSPSVVAVSALQWEGLGYNAPPERVFLRKKFKLTFDNSTRTERTAANPSLLRHYFPNNIFIEAPEFLIPSLDNTWYFDDDYRHYGAPFNNQSSKGVASWPFTRANQELMLRFSNVSNAPWQPTPYPGPLIEMPLPSQGLGSSAWQTGPGGVAQVNPFNNYHMEYVQKVYSAFPIIVGACRCPEPQSFLAPNYFTIQPRMVVEDVMYTNWGSVSIQYTKEELPFSIEIDNPGCQTLLGTSVRVIDNPATNKFSVPNSTQESFKGFTPFV